MCSRATWQFGTYTILVEVDAHTSVQHFFMHDLLSTVVNFIKISSTQIEVQFESIWFTCFAFMWKLNMPRRQYTTGIAYKYEIANYISLSFSFAFFLCHINWIVHPIQEQMHSFVSMCVLSIECRTIPFSMQRTKCYLNRFVCRQMLHKQKINENILASIKQLIHNIRACVQCAEWNRQRTKFDLRNFDFRKVQKKQKKLTHDSWHCAWSMEHKATIK